MSIIRELRKDFASIKMAKADLRKFGLTIGSVISTFVILLYYLRNIEVVWLLIVGIVLIVLGLIAPFLLHHLYYLWMAVSHILGFIVLRIVLAVVYYFLLTPIGLINKVMQRGRQSQHIQTSEAQTYWIPYERTSSIKDHLNDMY